MLDLDFAEASQHAEFRQQRLALVGHLILRAPPGVHAAQIGVIDLHRACQPMALIALPHGLHWLVLEQPAGVVVDAQLVPPFQGPDTVLGLGQQLDGEEPGREGQLGGVEEGAGQRGELALAAVALEGGAMSGKVAELARAAAGAA